MQIYSHQWKDLYEIIWAYGVDFKSYVLKCVNAEPEYSSHHRIIEFIMLFLKSINSYLNSIKSENIAKKKFWALNLQMQIHISRVV